MKMNKARRWGGRPRRRNMHSIHINRRPADRLSRNRTQRQTSKATKQPTRLHPVCVEILGSLFFLFYRLLTYAYAGSDGWRKEEEGKLRSSLSLALTHTHTRMHVLHHHSHT